jgi:hypothetical protein
LLEKRRNEELRARARRAIAPTSSPLVTAAMRLLEASSPADDASPASIAPIIIEILFVFLFIYYLFNSLIDLVG